MLQAVDESAIEIPTLRCSLDASVEKTFT